MSVAATADPTLVAVDAFNDPTQWDTVTRNVPVFVAHHNQGKDAQGRDIEYTVDEARLKRIAANAMKRWKESGVPIAFTEGHIIPDPKVPQKNQPPIHAYGINPRFGYFGPERIPAVLCDQYTRRGHLDAVRELPFRSADFQYADDQIISVALLRTWPQLDMGLVLYGQSSPTFSYAKSGNHLCCYAANFHSESAMPDPTLPPDAAQDNVPPVVPGGGDDEYGKTKPHIEQYMKECLPHLKDYHDKHIVQHMGGMPMVGGSGTTGTPGLPGGDDKPGAMPYSADPKVAQYAKRISDENQTLRTQLAEAQRGNRIAQYSKDIQAISREFGVQLDPVEELRGHEDDAAEKWVAHLTTMKRHVSLGRGPVGGEMIQLARDTTSKGVSEAHSDRAIQYMREHQLSGTEGWEQALKATK